MLIYSQKLIGAPVLSIRAGGPVTRVSSLIVDPNSLKIIGLFCQGGLAPRSGANILPVTSIREYSSLGLVINDAEDLVDSEEVVRIGEVLKLNFALPGLKVETKKGTKLGKIVEFTLNPDDFLVQQLIVHRPTLKALIDPELTIPRKEIIEVTDYKIIIKDEEDTLKKRAEKEDFVPNFVNPFRNQEPGFAPADTKTPGAPDKR